MPVHVRHYGGQKIPYFYKPVLLKKYLNLTKNILMQKGSSD